MIGRMLIAGVLFCVAAHAVAESPPAGAGTSAQPSWSAAGAASSSSTQRSAAQSGGAALQPIGGSPRRAVAEVSHGASALPNEHGQVWREYDLSPYTRRVVNTRRPEQAIVDWILRETGYEAWHAEPFGILSASSDKLIVYHTPDMHAVVAETVDRFVRSQAEPHAFGLRVISIANPNWRARAIGMLRPLPVQTQGIQAWLVQKEDAALLLAELRRRTDFREHSSPHMLVQNGQSAVVSERRPRSYVRDVTPRSDVWPAFEPEMAQFDEGFALEFSPLLGLDDVSIDAIIKCNIDQVEKLVPVSVEVPSAVAPRQRTKVDVPQITHYGLHERFRWPADQVLIVGLGMVAPPVPVDPSPLVAALPLPTSPARADLLVIVESRGAVPAQSDVFGRSAAREPQTYRDRY